MPGAQGTTIMLPPSGRPITAQDIRALRERRSELSNQLQSAEGRRNRLSAALEDAEGADRVGIEQRLRLLDERILQIETDIAITGQQLTNAPSHLLAGSTASEPRLFGVLDSAQTTAVSIVFTIFVFFPLAFAAARRMWKRGSTPPVVPALKDNSDRLQRLEQAVDAIAIEVERISEGQRYVTRIITEAQGMPALAAGQAPAEPIRVGNYDAVRVPREGQ